MKELKMHWKIRHLLDHMVLDDYCEDYNIYVPRDGAIITAHLPGRGDHRFDERMVEQVEVHPDGVIVVMMDDYENPINQSDLEGVKFSIYETVIVIG